MATAMPSPPPDSQRPLPLPRLIVLTGATASGKSDMALELALRLHCEIISADARQIYRDMPIGTAAPSPRQLAAVPHHMVGILPLDHPYSAARYEADVLHLLPDVFSRGRGTAILCGGSQMYIDALTRGIDDLPTISPSTRQRVLSLLHDEGLPALLARLRSLDPEYAALVDPQNTRRVAHALEICLQAGVPYSRLRKGLQPKPRPFSVAKYALDIPRDVLFARINARVDAMMQAGLLEEARRLYPLRHLNALNTVGYKELFSYFDGSLDLPTAVARIAKNTRVYAKKQLTWLRRDPSVTWISDISQIV